MAQKSTFERWRIPVTLTLAPAWLLALVLTRPAGFGTGIYHAFELIGLLLVFAAVLGRIWCSLYISGRKDRELCTDGPYSLSRNPLYFFSFLGTVGLPLAAQNPVLAAVSAWAFLFFYRAIIEREEMRLSRLFGQAFEDYRASVPCFLPRLVSPRRPKMLDVTVRTFERSLTEVAWFLVALAGMELLDLAKTSGALTTWTMPF